MFCHFERSEKSGFLTTNYTRFFTLLVAAPFSMTKAFSKHQNTFARSLLKKLLVCHLEGVRQIDGYHVVS
jgi:hypothetical protein